MSGGSRSGAGIGLHRVGLGRPGVELTESGPVGLGSGGRSGVGLIGPEVDL